MLKCLPRSTGAPEWPRPADMPALLHRLLCLRGMRSEEEARAFLRPGRDQLRDPFLLSDMEQAVQEIRAAIDAGIHAENTEGLVVSNVVIPSPHPDMVRALM